jgi:hypothetical protein
MLGAVDIPTRGIEYARKVLSDLEQKLRDAKARRDEILLGIRKAAAAIDAGDRRAVFTQGSLNKQGAEMGRLVCSIEAQLEEAKKRLAMAVNQAATVEAKRASVDAAAVPADKWFEVSCPDGRKVRHRHHSLEALQKALQPGYVAVGQVHGASDDGLGGFVAYANSNMMKALLESQGDELLAFLAQHGIKFVT